MAKIPPLEPRDVEQIRDFRDSTAYAQRIDHHTEPLARLVQWAAIGDSEANKELKRRVLTQSGRVRQKRPLPDHPLYAILPAGLARRQIAWERRQRAVNLLKRGCRQAEIARRLGVSPARVSQLLAQARRERKGQKAAKSPLAVWLAETQERVVLPPGSTTF